MKLFRINESGSRILIVKNLYLRHLGRKRNLWVYLPPEYYSLRTKRFAVVYVNDGQNLFTDSGNGCWRVDENADTRWYELGRNIIIVGIENDGDLRWDEYLPWREGAAYALDWRETIHPFISKNFRISRTREHTAFCGSSLGATILLEFLANHQDLIENYAFFSPAVEVDFEKMLEMARSIEYTQLCKMYVDIGMEEGTSQEDEELSDEEYVERADLFAQTLREHSMMPSVLVLDKVTTEHSEEAWSTRFNLAMSWLARDGMYFDPEDEDREIVIEDYYDSEEDDCYEDDPEEYEEYDEDESSLEEDAEDDCYDTEDENDSF